MWYIWLIAAIIFCIAEILYNGFFLLWFGIGSVAALIASLFTDNLVIQAIIFLVLSLVLLVTLTKHITTRFSKSNNTPTNIHKLIGQKGLVVKTIGQDTIEPGLVKLDGEIWSATSLDQTRLEEGTLVEVTDIKGVRLIVVAYQN